MIYVILPNLHVVLFFINFIVKQCKKIFRSYLIVNYIIFYSTIIIPNAPNKVDNSVKLRVVKYWSI